MAKRYELFIGGEWVRTGRWDGIEDKYTGGRFAEVALAGEEEVDRALAAARAAFPAMAAVPAHRRAAALEHVARRLEERREEIAETICREAGKAWKYSLGEVGRAVETFTFAAGAARSMHGETVPMDAARGGEGRIGFWLREPIGVVVAITPFNFPLNLVAHKVAPAIAAGCTLVLKPAGYTPVTAALLAEILAETDLPAGFFNLVHGPGGSIGKRLVEDPRPDKITFTGSVAVGTWIRGHAGLKRVTLELGNNSAVIVDEGADLDLAVERCLMGAFANSGQVCISVQRIYLHEAIAGEFREKFLAGVARQKVADPVERDTDIGPMISPADVERIEAWVEEAASGGAELLAGGRRISDRVFPPTVLTGVAAGMKLACEEAFAPVVMLETVGSFTEAVRKADDTPFGLQAGVFTPNLSRAFEAVRGINVGGVMINDVPTFRVDHMPYGGVKQSGIGREGVRFAVEEMTQIKMVVLNV